MLEDNSLKESMCLPKWRASPILHWALTNPNLLSSFERLWGGGLRRAGGEAGAGVNMVKLYAVYEELLEHI